METERYETIVIGGGQAGLAVGYFLKQAERSFAILDRSDRIGDQWRNRWDSLRLYSPAFRDGLPGMRFPAPPASYPTAKEMGDYLEAYAARFELPVHNGMSVDVLTREYGRYVATAGDRRFEADNVIVATGKFLAPYVPAFADELDPSITQLHSHEYRSLSQLQEGRVLVVGASHSGSDIAFEAAAERQVILSGKDTGQIPVPIESRRGRFFFRGLFLVGTYVLTVDTPPCRM
jgi:putative flavoprotein involved in K+ transport